jgi:hypothetical protein
MLTGMNSQLLDACCDHERRNRPTQTLALYDVELETGRTHQIRVHFAAAGMPLAHDFYYNPAAFHYAETYRYRAAAAEMHESRWPAGSELPLPPPAAPYPLACSAPAFFTGPRRRQPPRESNRSSWRGGAQVLVRVQPDACATEGGRGRAAPSLGGPWAHRRAADHVAS